MPSLRTSCLLILALAAAAARAQSTAFTYQGELSDGGAPVEGLCDVRFRLYDAAAGGAQLGATLCADNVPVAQGRFGVLVDFGLQFDGQDRFIEVEVRRDTGQGCESPDGFTILAPRQPVTPAPEALHARAAADSTRFAGQPASFYTSAGNLSGTLPSSVLSGSYLSAVTLANAGNVIAGSGAGLTNLNASAISSGTLPEARLPAGLPRLSADNAFTANNSFAGSVGIGTAAPAFKLDVRGGPVSFSNTGAEAELLWLSNERPWVLRQQGTGAEAALVLESVGGGGNKNFLVRTLGSIGIGTNFPEAKLHILGDFRSTSVATGAVTASRIVSENNENTSGSVGVYGATTSTSTVLQNMIGVHGSTESTSSNSFGVFSTGRFGATGTKAFRIDHPEDPQRRYLFHYCAEGPEVINFYRGTATLDAEGRAVVTLPSYFALINTRPSYQLTAVGAPMPMLHVAERISEASLRGVVEQAVDGERGAGPVCAFTIAGGVPGGEVCWRVEAVRNDEFVRRHGAPVEVEKAIGQPATVAGEGAAAGG